MRLWSLDFKYLDVNGLVACWRESLLAKNVLEGNTSGYKNHPQLNRFKNTNDPITSINTYLFYLYEEAMNRNYKFNKSKIGKYDLNIKINVTDKQLAFEFKHLQTKLKKRNKNQYQKNLEIKKVEPNKIFVKVRGNIEDWEKGVFETKYIDLYAKFLENNLTS